MASQLQAGVYVFQLKVTNTSGASSTATVQVRVMSTQRIADTGDARVMVYPNPVASMMTVQFTDLTTSGKAVLKIISMTGSVVETQETQVTGGQLIYVNVSSLAKGVYALQVVVGTKQTYQLIVKQ